MLKSPMVRNSMAMGASSFKKFHAIKNSQKNMGNIFHNESLKKNFEAGFKFGQRILDLMKKNELNLSYFLDFYSDLGIFLYGKVLIEGEKSLKISNESKILKYMQENTYKEVLLNYKYKPMFEIKNEDIENKYEIRVQTENKISLIERDERIDIKFSSNECCWKFYSVKEIGMVLKMIYSPKKIHYTLKMENSRDFELIIDEEKDQIKILSNSDKYVLNINKEKDTILLKKNDGFLYGFSFFPRYKDHSLGQNSQNLSDENEKSKKKLSDKPVDIVEGWLELIVTIKNAALFIDKFLIDNKVEDAYIFFNLRLFDRNLNDTTAFIHVKKTGMGIRKDELEERWINKLINLKKENEVLYATEIV